MFSRCRTTILLVSLTLVVGLLGACNSTPAPVTQAGKISVERSPINVGEEVNLTVTASGADLQFKWTTTAGTFLSSATAPSVRYKAPDLPGSAIVAVEVTGKGGTEVQNVTLQIVPLISDTPTPITLTPTSTPTPTPTPTITPTPTPISFQDFEDNNGTPRGNGQCDNYCSNVWFMPCTRVTGLPNQQRPYEGKYALQCTAQARPHGGTVGINLASAGPIDLSSAKTISVWVYDTQGNNNLELKLRDADNSAPQGIFSARKAVQNTWTKITWRLSDFTDVDKTRIENIELYEWNNGVYYFDLVNYQ
jgi:hypothetical protein